MAPRAAHARAKSEKSGVSACLAGRARLQTRDTGHGAFTFHFTPHPGAAETEGRADRSRVGTRTECVEDVSS